MKKRSAGILLYRITDSELQVLLVHPGGPYWRNKDKGAWSIPKGEFPENEDPFKTALREFREETGFDLKGKATALQPARLKSGKIVHAWMIEGDLDASKIVSNTFLLEWPPGSGKRLEVPEVDRAEWFGTDEALLRINPAQATFISQLKQQLGS